MSPLPDKGILSLLYDHQRKCLCVSVLYFERVGAAGVSLNTMRDIPVASPSSSMRRLPSPRLVLAVASAGERAEIVTLTRNVLPGLWEGQAGELALYTVDPLTSFRSRHHDVCIMMT